MEYAGNGDTSCTSNGFQRFWKKTGGIWNQSKNQDHPDDCIFTISKSTEKSPGNLKKIAVIQTLVKHY